MYYSVHVNPGIGERQGIDNIMDLSYRCSTGPLFVGCTTLVGTIGDAVFQAIGIAMAAIQPMTDIDGAAGLQADQMLERFRTTSIRGNLHMTLYGENAMRRPRAYNL